MSPCPIKTGVSLGVVKHNKTSQTQKIQSCSATICVQKLSSRSESSLGPGGWDCSLEELLLGVEQDVLLASDDGDALPAKPGDGVEGGGGHSHGVGDLLRFVVQLAVSPQCIGLYFPPFVAVVVEASCEPVIS